MQRSLNVSNLFIAY